MIPGPNLGRIASIEDRVARPRLNPCAERWQGRGLRVPRPIFRPWKETASAPQALAGDGGYEHVGLCAKLLVEHNLFRKNGFHFRIVL
jgi:hypothetical protein